MDPNAFELIEEEWKKAQRGFPAFNSCHEGYSVILEELDELWEEIKTKNRDPDRLVAEAVQVGAMAARFLTDIALPLQRRKDAATAEWLWTHGQDWTCPQCRSVNKAIREACRICNFDSALVSGHQRRKGLDR
jgi:hypothetical protein